MLKGVRVASGFAIGEAIVLREINFTKVVKSLNEGQLEAEMERFKEAVDKAKQQLQQIENNFRRDVGEEQAAIFVAQQMFLEDPALVDEVIEQIRTRKVNAEQIVQELFEAYAETFEQMEDMYLRERASDIRDVGSRLLANLQGVTATLTAIKEESIVIARELTPSTLAQLDRQKVIGIAIEEGGSTSHTAILARTLGIPTVIGIRNLIDMVSSGDKVIIDGQAGVIYLNPDEDMLISYRVKEATWKKEQQILEGLKDLPSVTQDGYEVQLMANIGMPADVPLANFWNAAGVGLFRTEFLYLDRDSFPNEEEQFQAYKVVAAEMQGKPVIIRTLDIGGDKELAYFPLPKEDNPFLGLRAIRLSLKQQDIFKTQLRAILRASSYGNIKIMYPMVSSVKELLEANHLLAEAKRELEKEGYTFSKDIEVGIMVETPAVAMLADIFAQEVDFFSIGTNDLVQYTLAVDRLNQDIAVLYDHYHPAVLRMIKMVVDAAHKEGIWAGICGEMAADVLCTPVFLGMEIDELSMNAIALPEIKRVVGSLTQSNSKEVMTKTLALRTGSEVKEYLQEVYQEHGGGSV